MVKAKCVPLPEDWSLSEKDREFFKLRTGADDAAADLEAERFAAYHQSRGSLMASWPAAWRTWALNIVKFRGIKPPKINGYATEDLWDRRLRVLREHGMPD